MLEIKSSADLIKIIDICRKKGVESIKVDGVELKLRAEAPPSPYKRKQLEEESSKAEVPLTEDDILFWSSQGLGDNHGENHAQ